MGDLRTKKIIVIIASLLAAGFLVFIVGKALAASYYYKAGVGYLRAENFKGAKENCLRSLYFNSRNPLAYWCLGRSFMTPKRASDESIEFLEPDYQGAITNYEKAITLGIEKVELGPNYFFTALDDLGNAYFKLGEHDKSNEYYLKVIELFPEKSFFARYFVSVDYMDRLNKPKDALDTLLPALDTSNAKNYFLHRVYSRLASLYLYFEDAGNVEKYARLALESVSDESKNIDINSVNRAQDLLAMALAAKGDFVSAEAESKKASDAAGQQICLLSRYYILVENYVRAEEIIKQGLKSEKPHARCIFSAARLYGAKGQTAEAAKYFRQYLNFSPTLEQRDIFVARAEKEARKALENINK